MSAKLKLKAIALLLQEECIDAHSFGMKLSNYSARANQLADISTEEHCAAVLESMIASGLVKVDGNSVQLASVLIVDQTKETVAHVRPAPEKPAPAELMSPPDRNAN